ncbi:MAG: reverse transcriptase domain-containing protein, partial [Anaplasma sp.]|nr:reverse transcriptase domain-containing protein [Anaplasma sp.]
IEREKGTDITKEGHLEVFFSAKTHKVDVPFRAIVSERGTWQVHLSTFLAKQLSLIHCNDPYMIRNSEQLISYLQENGSSVASGFSIDIQDMYYSIPHASLMSILRHIIEEQGSIPFQNAAGINVDTFLELLSGYLTSTVVAHQGQHFLQKSGVCIGSRIAPQLCDLFLAARGRIIQDNLKDTRIMAIFRYVDDFLILHTKEVGDQGNGCKQTVLQCFQESCPDLVFTYELPVDMAIKFLDLKLEFKDRHVCWTYEPRSSKGFLPFASGHSKTIKRSVANTALLSALNKSCHHTTESSFKRQISRLRDSGYPNSLLVSVCEDIGRR